MKQFYIFALLFYSFAFFAQDKHCATDILMQRAYEKNPGLKEEQLKRNNAEREQSSRALVATTYTIPVVFHILHVGGTENISDAQVKDAMLILNRDFAKLNPDTTEIIPAFKNLADETHIQFMLATKDPSGNCTNGIKHYYDTDTDWNDLSPTLYSHTWSPTKYMNVYIVRTITLSGGFGAAGYTYFPGTWPTNDSQDAIVVLNHYFGSIGTGDNFLSRVLTHEVGHWLNLFHIFGGTNGAGVDCFNDDFVNDTPTTPGYLSCPNPANPAEYQVCTPGISENFQNYMDYSYCCRMFTHDQSVRMQNSLQNNLSARDNLSSNSNLIATGIIFPAPLCAPIADFKYNRAKTCAGTAVTFSDASWNGLPATYNWSFPGGTPATSTLSSPVVTYATPGLYSVTYSSSNSAGTAAAVTKTNVITVTNNIATYANGLSEGFENATLLNANWILDISNGAAKWEQTTNASYTGQNSIMILGKNNTRKTITSMISPPIDISNLVGPTLTFKVATAEVTPDHVNTLKVYASTNCGDTWTQLYSKTGQALITSPSNIPDFIPFNFSQWRFETVNLQALAPKNYVNLRFEYTRDTIAAGNNIFIDDINVTSLVSIQENNAGVMQNLNVFPVPSKGNVTVSFSLSSDQRVKFSLLDISGRALESTEESGFSAGEHTQVVNAANTLAPGIYFLKIETGKTSRTGKIIIAE